jgi:hypothetical protein
MGSDGCQHSHQHGAEFGSHSDQHSAQAPRRRVEVITGLDRRWRWDEDLKAEIVAEAFLTAPARSSSMPCRGRASPSSRSTPRLERALFRRKHILSF